MNQSPLILAKGLIDIDYAWNALGLPGQPGKCCKSPFRADRKPSFSVFNDSKSWKDHATGEGGDVIDFVATSEGIGKGDACRWLIRNAGTGHRTSSIPRPQRAIAGGQNERPQKPSIPLRIPPLDRGSYSHVLRLQESRELPMNAGLELLIQREVLQFGGMYDGCGLCRVWLLLDSSLRNAQARRLDGKPWQRLPGNPKAKTLKYSVAAWPIGAADLIGRDVVMFCEGGPDLLAAATAAYIESAETFNRIGFVCMAGASNQIASDALPLFSGKVIRIYQHADTAGRAAAGRWYWQLQGAGAASVDRWESDREGEDLNDYVSRNASDLLDGVVGERITPELLIRN